MKTKIRSWIDTGLLVGAVVGMAGYMVLNLCLMQIELLLGRDPRKILP